jgi:hypothetical protein
MEHIGIFLQAVTKVQKVAAKRAYDLLESFGYKPVYSPKITFADNAIQVEVNVGENHKVWVVLEADDMEKSQEEWNKYVKERAELPIGHSVYHGFPPHN